MNMGPEWDSFVNTIRPKKTEVFEVILLILFQEHINKTGRVTQMRNENFPIFIIFTQRKVSFHTLLYKRWLISGTTQQQQEHVWNDDFGEFTRWTCLFARQSNYCKYQITFS